MRPGSIALPCVLSIMLSALSALAEAPAASEVRLPLERYDEMIESARDPKKPERPAPARFALGNAAVRVAVDEDGAKLSAHVSIELQVRVLEDGWVAVPLLPNGTALASASVDNRSVELVSTSAGLAFSTDRAGSHQVKLEYDVDAQTSPQGRALSLALPEAPSSTLQATLPGTGLDVALIPAAAVRAQDDADGTAVTATIPSTRGVQLSWRVPGEHGHSLSRARYRGALVRDAMRFDAELSVELYENEALSLPLLPSDVTLSALAIDGKPSAIGIEEDQFAARVRGRGMHRVALSFELPVVRDDGPPHVDLRLPQVPVSELEVTLPGDKEVSLDPVAHVDAVRRGNTTVSHAFLPLTSELKLSWAEAVPEAANEELLAQRQHLPSRARRRRRALRARDGRVRSHERSQQRDRPRGAEQRPGQRHPRRWQRHQEGDQDARRSEERQRALQRVPRSRAGRASCASTCSTNASWARTRSRSR